MIEWMDRVWREAGLDLGMKPYMCQSSGVGVGLIEVVPNAMTIAQIHHTYGVMYFGALMETPIDSFLREKSSGLSHHCIFYDEIVVVVVCQPTFNLSFRESNSLRRICE